MGGFFEPGTLLPFAAQCIAAVFAIGLCGMYLCQRSTALAAYRDTLSKPLSAGDCFRYRYHRARFVAFRAICGAFASLAVAGIIGRYITHTEFPGQLALLAVIVTLTAANSFQREEDKLLDAAIR